MSGGTFIAALCAVCTAWMLCTGCSRAGGGGGGAPLPKVGSTCGVEGQQTCGVAAAGGSTRMTCTGGVWTLTAACPAGSWCKTTYDAATGLQGTVCDLPGGSDTGDVDAGGDGGATGVQDTAAGEDGGAASGCKTAADCDDGDACTTDGCVNGGCKNTPLDGCGSPFSPCAVLTSNGGPGDDKTCPAGRYCHAGKHMCVECLSSKHCGPTQRCKQDQCVDAGVACSGDAQCKAIDKVCNTKGGYCAECVTPADCGPGEVCVDDTCAKACATSKDCPVVCDKDKGACVDCVVHSDCPGGKWCDDTGKCRKPRCQGETCVDVTVLSGSDKTALAHFACVDNGAAWKPLNVCFGKADVCQIATCDPATGCGTKAAPPGTKCGSKKVCDASGTCVCDNPKKQWPDCYYCKNPELTGSGCDKCKDSSKKAPDCVLCADEQMTGPGCDVCIGQSKCNKCDANDTGNCLPNCAKKACKKIIDDCLDNKACSAIWGCLDDCGKGKQPPGSPKGDTCKAKCINLYDDAMFSGTTDFADINICLNAYCMECPAAQKSVCVAACGQMLCLSEKAACDASQSCRALRACFQGCDSDACLDKCQKSSTGDGIKLANEWFACGMNHKDKCK